MIWGSSVIGEVAAKVQFLSAAFLVPLSTLVLLRLLFSPAGAAAVTSYYTVTLNPHE